MKDITKAFEAPSNYNVEKSAKVSKQPLYFSQWAFLFQFNLKTSLTVCKLMHPDFYKDSVLAS